MVERENHPSASHIAFPYFFSDTEGIFLTGVPIPVVPEVPFALDSSVAIAERINPNVYRDAFSTIYGKDRPREEAGQSRVEA